MLRCPIGETHSNLCMHATFSRHVTPDYLAVTAELGFEEEGARCPKGTSCSPCKDLPWLKAAAADSSFATYMRGWL